ncbi:MAG: MFS transporter [Gemmatimonadaceae bacterium]|nr:MFS transporter [Gemmatimonadaceae bacterium]
MTDSLIAVAQRRTLRLLFVTQIISGVGVAIGASVGALLAADLVGTGASGLAQSSVVVGAALLALPATAIVQRRGRRPSLASTYLVAAIGSVVVVAAAMRSSAALLFPGFFLFGAATTANMQARYAAVDLAPPALRGRHLSLIVWATTLGAVAGPNLTAFAGAALSGRGVPTLAGPFALSAVLFVIAAVVISLVMHPDPAVLARQAALGDAVPPAPRRVGLRAAFGVVSSHSTARLGMIAVAVGHLIMVGVMAMTPVHIRGGGHGPTDTLRIVGIVLSFHIAGMYAFSPIVGWMTDRVGGRRVILAGLLFLIGACALAGTAGHDTTRLAAGLMLLGLGWSSTMVAGSTLLSASVPVEMRASAQGLSDFSMGIAGATAGALSGVIVGTWSYAALAFVAALSAVPFLVAVARPARS